MSKKVGRNHAEFGKKDRQNKGKTVIIILTME